mmetsp:Transcript_7679/g.18771  ORF Transcript_7679/g.18771 Transcript_7679/m.18771 type:complete len:426 (+) Transcript_7679:449-1726(+)
MHHLTANSEEGGEGQATASELTELVRLYAQQPHWLMVLLEYLASVPHPSSLQPQGTDAALLWETLLDLYLSGGSIYSPEQAAAVNSDSASLHPELNGAAAGAVGGGAAYSNGEDRARACEKALALLSGVDASYSPASALMLCTQHGFELGVKAVLEKGRLYSLIVQRLLLRGDHAQALLACRRYSEAEPALWVRVLQHWSSIYTLPPSPPLVPASALSTTGSAGESAVQSAINSTVDSAGGSTVDLLALIEEALDEVERLELLPPVQVLEELARNPSIPLAPARAFLLRYLQGVRLKRAEDERQARSHLAEVAAMRAELAELKTGACVFQLSRCCRSGAPLELPTVHFLCGHSYNRSALAEGLADACPLCAPEHARVLGRQRTLEARATQHDNFFKQLEGSADGFATVAEYFGRGVMGSQGRTAQ